MQPRIVLFIGNFFLSIFTALTIYIMLPYLSSFMPEAYAGFVIAFGGLIALIGFPYLPRLVERHGAQQLALAFAIIEMLTLFALATVPSVITGIILIAVTLALQPFLAYELDLMLEATGDVEGMAGRVRTFFLTGWNIGALVAPLLIGALLATADDYNHVFLITGACLLPFIVLFAAKKLPGGTPPKITHMSDTLVCIANDRDLSAVTAGHFILWLFYGWAPFYVPIYLHTVLNIPWSTLGWMFSIMLVPYVLIDYPAGWLADRFLGDKELMFAGFLIAGGALASFSLLTTSSSIYFILGILIASRVGTSLIESMTEGHFFRRVTEKDINSISFFRSAWPLAYIVAPVAASLLLYFGSYQIFFLTTGGFIALAGATAAFLIRDFR